MTINEYYLQIRLTTKTCDMFSLVSAVQTYWHTKDSNYLTFIFWNQNRWYGSDKRMYNVSYSQKDMAKKEI